MLKCKDIVDQASDYREREMSFGQRLQYRMHLLLCHHCRTFSRQFNASVAMLKRLRKREDHQEQIEETKRKLENL
ncbi:zf-HC2 domain-containing protein [Motiliproteus coralliicola]|uniref:Zf-HC2 domain-containing protein n=1 Tax=Motiliproteus coralliicola TaxID=2283196 RepID=A0A369WS33_9GAMM|nr:zf-HC2 domain-containing protein [Motiliproteus coralliicola]RDE24482.1 zf-HC2 domain-containing protein [Motiliproteus coralliicola]